MLSKEQIEILTDKYITQLYDDLEREVIADIARRARKTERFTETAELMAQALREQGYSTGRIQHEVYRVLNADKEYQRFLAENTREYKQDVKKLIEQTEAEAVKNSDILVATAGEMSFNDDMQLWKAHDIDLHKPNSLSQLYKAIADQTGQELKNLTQSSGFKNTVLGTTGVYNAYQRTMDLAMLKVSSGAFSYQQAAKDCVDQLAKSGLRSIDYASGRSYQLDAAVRMCVRTGMSQLAGRIQEENLKQTDTPLVYVDAHAGSRPEHAVWQGQVYAYNPDGVLKDGSKASEKYGDFFNETDYGSPTGLMGVNCAHHFYPYWEGDPIPEYHEPDPIEYEGKEYTYYEATQEMRKQERGIRQTKREIEAMKNLGEDTSALQRKLSKQMTDYKNFSKAADINPRNYVLGVKPGTSDLGLGYPAQSSGKYEQVHYDENAAFRVPDMGFGGHIQHKIEEAAREVARLGEENGYENGILVGTESGNLSKPFTSEDPNCIYIDKEAAEQMGDEHYCLVHNHLTDTEVSEGDAWAIVGYEKMDANLAVRGNGKTTAIVGQVKEGYNFLKDPEYWEANSEAYANELTVAEKDRRMRNVIIKNAGLRLLND